jgi:hypothetical protein
MRVYELMGNPFLSESDPPVVPAPPVVDTATTVMHAADAPGPSRDSADSSRSATEPALPQGVK